LILEAEAIRRENEELRKMLGVIRSQGEKVVTAEVIAVNQELSGKFYMINKGKKDGVDVNQAVLTADGVFGKIYSAGENSAVVIPINHPLSAVSARISETGELGIVEGSVNGNLYLKLIPKESQASIGMIVVTSGFGGVYPKNMLVGTIKRVKEDPNRLDLEIEVGPACDFDSVDFVMVVTGNKNEKN
ncbi:MAG: rod shape-determining protein MreC, partial [Actinobacteria bacterium]|nr:rod shape-determining protein MreC [Actinomycetota bacterium]